MKIDGVFEGGGVKGIGLVGAVCCLEDHGYTWEQVAGTSSGSIVASLLAVGYKGSELKEILLNLNYMDFLSRSKWQALPLVGKPIGIFKFKGLYNGENIKTWIYNLLKAKGKTKFKDVYKDGKSRLKIIASDVTKKRMIILPDELSQYGIDPMEFEIAEAVRMSISIPFYFTPVKLKYKNGESLIVDGGVSSNFPVWIFDVDGIPRWPTFGLKLTEGAVESKNGNNIDVLTFGSNIIDTMVDRREEMFIRDKDLVRIMSIPSGSVKTKEFDITKEKSLALFNTGYNSAKEFLGEWDFKEYVKNYRS